MDFNDIRGVLLDFDGTLVDSEPIHFKANSRVFFEEGHVIDETEYYIHWSLHGEGPAGEIQRHGLNLTDIDDLRRRSRTCFLELLESEPVRLLPGAKDLLETLPRRGYRTVIASNTPEDLIHRMLRRAGIDPCPVPVIGARPGLRGKPHPDIFLAARDTLNLHNSQCLIVEDTVKGLKSALAAEIPCIMVKYPRYPVFDTTGAVGILNSLEELLDRLP